MDSRRVTCSEIIYFLNSLLLQPTSFLMCSFQLTLLYEK